ncbi:hypothetical protein ACWD04_06540 [Streptomyces sp. NPDC002911]
MRVTASGGLPHRCCATRIGLHGPGYGTAELRAESFRLGLRHAGLSPVAEVEVTDLHRAEGARARVNC